MPKGDEEFQQYVEARTKPVPEFLYKYTTVDTARIILSSGQLRYSSPLGYNDPYDAQWDPFWPTTTEQAMLLERQYLEEVLRNPDAWPDNGDSDLKAILDPEWALLATLDDNARDARIVEFVNRGTPADRNGEQLLRHLDDFRRRLRVFCASSTPKSITMWSHYADEHRGVVLAFHTQTFENAIKRPFQEVEYCQDLPILFDLNEWARGVVCGVNREPDLANMARKMTLAKHTEWRYEKEWRCATIAEKGTLGDRAEFDFPRHSLAGIIGGCRIDPTRMRELKALACAVQPNIQVGVMSRHEHKFELIVRPF